MQYIATLAPLGGNLTRRHLQIFDPRGPGPGVRAAVRQDGQDTRYLSDDGVDAMMSMLRTTTAARIRREQPDRIMKCRFVRDFRRSMEVIPDITMEREGLLVKAKSRLAALGHLDPDLNAKMADLRLGDLRVDYVVR